MESSAKARRVSGTRWIEHRRSASHTGKTRRDVLRQESFPDPWGLIESAHRREPLRRAANVLIALVGLVTVAPLCLLIAFLVKLTSPGSVVYSQKRVGVDRRNGGSEASADDRSSKRATAGNLITPFSTDGHDPSSVDGNGKGARGAGSLPTTEAGDQRTDDRGGRIFTIYKFRTMYVDSGEEQVWAREDDDRVTPVGRVLRALHLDELPQLVNVLLGDMNVVGPRPEQPDIFQSLARDVPGYRLRQRVRPGITGWAQVNHHYDRTLEDVRTKVDFDLEYLQRRSAIEDLRIIFKTVPAVLAGEDVRSW